MKKTFYRLLKLAQPLTWPMLLAAFIGFLTIGSSIGLMMTSAYIIAKAALQPTIAALQIAIVGVRFFGITRGIFRYLERILSHEVTFKLLAQLRVWFYTAIEPLAPARLQLRKSGDLLSRIISDINTLENFYLRIFAPPLVALFVSILLWFVFGMFSWVFSLILTIYMLSAGLGVPLLTHLLCRDVGKKLVRLESDLSILTLDGLQGLPELLTFGRVPDYLEHFAELNSKFTRLQRARSLLSALHESLITLLMNATIFTIFIAAIPFIRTGLMDGLYLAVLALGSMAAFEAVFPLPAAALHLEESLTAAGRLFEMTDAAHPSKEPARVPTITCFDISFKNVHFAYAPNESPVLQDLNLDIPTGNKIAILGPSGSGKTTIVNLLMRFWTPQSGVITLGGISLENIPQHILTDLISYVPQNPYLFSGTIRENLLSAKPGADESELVAACKQAHIHDFILSLPEDYATWIGEHGLRLSGGERQRLALARGVLKNAPIYIFDEPIAHLDAKTAKDVLASIVKMADKRTIVIISHTKALVEQINKSIYPESSFRFVVREFFQR